MQLTSTKSINGLIEKFPSVYQFCDGDLDKFVLLLRKRVFILMNTWIAGKNLMKHCYHIEAFYSE